MADAAPVSMLDKLRANPAGALVAGIVVMLAVSLLLSTAYPEKPSIVLVVLLSAIVVAAVAMTVRMTGSGNRDALTAAALSGMGVHMLLGVGSSTAGEYATPFGDAIMETLQTPPLSAGVVLSALVAIAVVVWKK